MLEVIKIDINNNEIIFHRKLSETVGIKESYKLSELVEININTDKCVKISPTFNEYKIGDRLICIKSDHKSIPPCEVVEIEKVIRKKKISVYKLEGYKDLFTTDMLDNIFRRY